MERKTTHIPPEDIARQREYCGAIREINSRFAKAPLAFVDTYGCQQNEADSERLRGYLSEMGYHFTDSEAEADVIVINTCAIREHAEMRVLGNVGALVHTKRAKPGQLICVCGCMAQEPHMAQKIKESYRQVDLVFGPHALWRFPELLYRLVTRRGRIFDIADEPGSIAEGIPLVRQEGVKAWVSIMYGCNNFCTYCIVPYVRGRERSREPGVVLEEIRGLVAEGYKDITLLGQNVNSYGKDLEEPMDFADLLKAASEIEGDFLLRFMTSHPKDASRKLIDTIAAQPKVCKHIHLPVQCGSDRLLAQMNRHYTAAQYLALIDYARKTIPGVTFSSDIIVGFPGETEEDFLGTLDLVEGVGYMQLFTFIYSRREGTPAADMEDPTPRAEKTARMERLLKVQERHSHAAVAALVGRTVRVLVEGAGRTPGTLNGRLDNNLVVEFPAPESRIGQWARVELTGARAAMLTGRLAED